MLRVQRDIKVQCTFKVLKDRKSTSDTFRKEGEMALA